LSIDSSVVSNVFVDSLRDLSKDYEEAMLKRNKDKAYEISVELVEMALKLSDITHEQKTV